MKKIFVMMFALLTGIGAASAQEQVTTENDPAAVQTGGAKEEAEKVALQKEVYPQKEEDGDLYHGLTKKLTFDRMIPPHGLEVTYDKTVHVIFPAAVRYVDLGSPNLIAGKADGTENVIGREGHRARFPHGDQYVGHYRGRLVLYLQCEIRRRTAVTERRDVRLHP